MESLRGQLLIAGPGLLDPNFWRAVVLIVEHSEEGAFGLVLNRPSESAIGETVPELGELIDGDEPLYVGGPVQPSAVIVLGHFEDPSDAALLAFEELSVALRTGRAFAGHSGWGAGQLEAELERGDWITEPAVHEDAFTASPHRLWADVLARKGGRYVLLARMPPDPSLN
jgi:putative transcriptional regulator